MLGRTQGCAADGWEFEQLDLLDTSHAERIIADRTPDLLIHLAAQSSIDAAIDAAEATWRVNFGGTFALASAMARHAPGGTVFFTSSGEVYGRSFLHGRTDEDTPAQPGNAYGASKLAAEYALSQILPADMRLIIARPFNHTGPGQDERFALPSFAAQIARIEAGQAPPVIKVGDLTAQRDFLHVADVVDAYMCLLTRPELGRRILMNVSSGTSYRIGDLLGHLCAMATVPVRIEVDPARTRSSKIPAALGDPSRLKALTGWEPRHGIDLVLAELLEWWRGRIRSAATLAPPPL